MDEINKFMHEMHLKLNFLMVLVDHLMKAKEEYKSLKERRFKKYLSK